MSAQWEVKISLYRNGRRIEFFDALGDSPKEALWNATTDAECWADDREAMSTKRHSAAPTPPSKPLAAQLAPPTRTSATEAQREDRG